MGAQLEQQCGADGPLPRLDSRHAGWLTGWLGGNKKVGGSRTPFIRGPTFFRSVLEGLQLLMGSGVDGRSVCSAL